MILNQQDRSAEQHTSIPTLERPLYLLGFFTPEQPRWQLNKLVRASGLPKTSCYRSLKALEAHGLVQHHDGHYALGTRLITLGAWVHESNPPRQTALPFMTALRNRTRQSVQWVIREGLYGVYLEAIESLAGVRLYIAPGRRAPLYAGASTRLLLAFAPKEVQQQVFASPLKRYTPNTPANPELLQDLLEESRATWFALSMGELEPYSAELSAPVFDAVSHLVGVMSLAGTDAEYKNPDTLLKFTEALSKTSEEVSRELGFTGPWLSDSKVFLHRFWSSRSVAPFRKGVM